MFSGKRTKYYFFNDFTSVALISDITLLILSFAIIDFLLNLTEL